MTAPDRAGQQVADLEAELDRLAGELAAIAVLCGPDAERFVQKTRYLEPGTVVHREDCGGHCGPAEPRFRNAAAPRFRLRVFRQDTSRGHGWVYAVTDRAREPRPVAVIGYCETWPRALERGLEKLREKAHGQHT